MNSDNTNVYAQISLSKQASSSHQVNHSLYNTPHGSRIQVQLAQVWLQMTFDIAGSQALFIPFHVIQYAKALLTFTEDLSTTHSGTLKQNNITLGRFYQPRCRYVGADDFQTFIFNFVLSKTAFKGL